MTLPRFVRHRRDVRDGAVRVLLVAKQDLAALLEFRHELGRREPGAVVVLHRDHEPLPAPGTAT